MDIEAFIPGLNNSDYIQNLLEGFELRIAFLKRETQKNNSINRLPEETIHSLELLVFELKRSLYKTTLA